MGSFNRIGTLNWVNGTLRIRSQSINLGPGEVDRPFGAAYALSPGRNLEIDGTATVRDGGSLTINGGSFKIGTLIVDPGGTFDFLDGSLIFSGNRSFSAAFANLIDLNSPLLANRSLQVLGQATIDAPITLAGGVFSAGTLVNPHRLILDTGTLNVNAGPLAVADGTSVDASSGMTLNAAGGLSVAATGQFNAIGTTLNAAAASTNAGDINAINSTLTFTGGLTSPGRLRLIDTTVNGPVNLPGAAVEVAGGATFNGPVSGSAPFSGASGVVTFNGGYAPGDSAAAVAFDGGLALGAANVLRIEIGGTSRGTQYDAVDVGGAAALGGALDVMLTNGFVPQPMDSFDVVRFATASDSFDAYTGLDIPGQLALAPLPESDRFRLVATLPGDANVDGSVNFNDLAALAQNYNNTDGQRLWPHGDFTYDGNVDFNDLAALAQNYNVSTVPTPGMFSPAFDAQWQGALEQAAIVPEPATLLLFAGAGLLVPGRRRAVRRDP
jgi:hypothetical protein